MKPNAKCSVAKRQRIRVVQLVPSISLDTKKIEAKFVVTAAGDEGGQ